MCLQVCLFVRVRVCMGQSAGQFMKQKQNMDWPFVRERRASEPGRRNLDVCLARPKVCPTDIVRPHSAQLMIYTSANQFCIIWSSADWSYVMLRACVCACV